MEIWDTAIEALSIVINRASIPIDNGILDTVVALNLLGIYTLHSCEGHLDHSLPHPWINIEAPEYEDLRLDESSEIRKVQMKLAELGKQYALTRMQEIKVQHAPMQQRYFLLQLLTAFYTDRHVSFDRMITFQMPCRILSQGADFIKFLTPEEQKQKLQEYQEEMAAFTTFLKERFFSY